MAFDRKWVGRGGGRTLNQPTISEGPHGWGGPGGPPGGGPGGGWRGHGGGRRPHQPNIGPAGGTGTEGSLTVGSPGDWKGRGKGRAGSQPTISAANTSGARAADAQSGKTIEGTTDPEGAYYFALEIDGTEIAHFLECSGIKSTTTVFELEEGGVNHAVHKLPGQSRWENLVLRQGVTNDTLLLGWRDEILQDKFNEDSRRSGSIVLKNNHGDTIRRYEFVDAWPVAYEGPSFSASSSEIAVEMIELAHHGVYIKSGD